ncbi:MAG: hydrogenase, partial [Bdellovibrionales bacterium]|nr:hydrogenase [Bdellovibrionales bacterium]
PQIFWFKSMRRNLVVMFIVSIFVNIGMWFERYVITVTSLHRDFLPVNWDYFSMTFFDLGVLFGSFGMFFTLFLFYIRALPAISIAEVKPVLSVGREDHHAKSH